MFPIFASERAETRMGFKNTDLQDLVAKAQVEADPDARAKLYVDAQKIVLDDATMVILGYPERAIGAKATVQNLLVSPVGSLVLREVDLAG